MRHLHSKLWLACELLLLMFAVPALLYFILPIKYLLLVIWVAALGCHFGAHVLTPAPRVWWVREAVTWAAWRPILLRFLIAAPLLMALTYFWHPELLFSFVRTNPPFWLLIMLLYPLLSVVPQEIIYRRFFFTRYEKLLPTEGLMIVASGLAFGWAHILFHNWLAPLLCIAGGLMFSKTYQKHRSLMLVSLEHALYGDFIFTIGLGHYFFHGAVGH